MRLSTIPELSREQLKKKFLRKGYCIIFYLLLHHFLSRGRQFSRPDKCVADFRKTYRIESERAGRTFRKDEREE